MSLSVSFACILLLAASQVVGLPPSNAGTERTAVLFRVWQLCGDVHCLSTKVHVYALQRVSVELQLY